jgi:uncharacterized protein involved in tolerance to divalent cations
MVSLLNVKVSKIKRTKEFDLEKKTSDQRATEVVHSIKSNDFYVRPKISFEKKGYLETYYHHS